MIRKTLGGYSNINSFVAGKLKTMDGMEKSFRSLCLLMYSEQENIMYESSHGYEIKKTTYGESFRNVILRAEKLKKALPDLPKDSVIGLDLDNSLDWIELFWAILACGYCPLLMNRRLSSSMLEDALKSIGCKAVISDGRSYGVPVYDYREFSAEGADTVAFSGDPEALLPKPFGSTLYVMSSGTSMHVKVCGYTAQEFYYQIRGSYSILLKSRDIKKHYKSALKHLLFLPLYHIFGLAAAYTWFAFFSRTFVELPDLAPDTILNTIRRHGVTHIFAVPLFFEEVYDEAIHTIEARGEKTVRKFEKGLAISEKLENHPFLSRVFSKIAFKEVRDNMFGPGIRYLITGGAGIRPEVLRFFNAIGYHLSDGYGMTEIGITSVELSSRPKVLNSASVGSPMDAVEYRINTEGELLVRGRVMAYSITEDGKTTYSDGEHWFNTHDLAEEKDGRYYILGRRDDLVIGNSGENLNPVLIEPELLVPGLNAVCLTAIEKNGVKSPVLVVSVPEGTDEEAVNVLQGSLGERLDALHLRSEINRILITDRPLMEEEDFKLNRKKIGALAAEGAFPEIGAKKTREERDLDAIEETIRAYFAEALHKEPEEIDLHADFFTELGGTSLDYFGMMAKIRDQYQVDFPYDSGSTFFTVQGVADFVKDQVQG